jgi:hypothetical protein
LYAAAIELDSTHKLAWCGVWDCVLDVSIHELSRMAVPPGIPARTWVDVAKRTLVVHDDGDYKDAYWLAKRYISIHMTKWPEKHTWSRQMHACGVWQNTSVAAVDTEVMFATLLRGIQRLETMGVLAPSHGSMLEDMLECWTWRDHRDLYWIW